MSEQSEIVAEARKKRHELVSALLQKSGTQHQDAAVIIGINPRTFREWVALGKFDESKKDVILETLNTSEEELNRHFKWFTKH